MNSKAVLLAVGMAAIMVLSIVPVVSDDVQGDDGNSSVKMNDGYYSTISAAITAMGDSKEATITLMDNLKENVVIPREKNITLDLNNYTITNDDGSDKSHTIVNEGTLVIIGDGKIDSIIHGKAALYNKSGSTAILNGGEITRSKETGLDPYISGEGGNINSWYTILNHGSMIINDGAKVTQVGRFSSLLVSGWGNSADSLFSDEVRGPVDLTINGGYISGGANTIKNDGYGTLTINGGTFVNDTQGTVFNTSKAIINGGTFIVNPNENDTGVINNGYYANDFKMGEIIINGGSFQGSVAFYKIGSAINFGGMEIKGGDFKVSEKVFDPRTDNNPRINVSGGSFSLKVDEKYLDPSVDFVINDDGSMAVGDSIPKEPSVPPTDDDDELPFIPPQSGDDGGADTTTYVAVAAAAAVVAILAVLAVGISKGKL